MSGEAGNEGHRERLFVALKNLVATLLAIGKTRAELLVTEVEEEKLRLMTLWAKAIGASFFMTVGIVMAVIFIALLFQEHHLLVFGIAAVIFIGGALLLVVSLRRQFSRPSKLFRASLSELEADMAQLRRKEGQG
jgi:uncharacterized membrane protein YqjE